MPHHSRWVTLKDRDIAPETRPADAPWAIESPSLYDIPTHARAWHDTADGRVGVEFRYLAPERLKRVDHDGGGVVHQGLRTQRVWSLSVAGGEGAPRTPADLAQALPLLLSTLNTPNRPIVAAAVALYALPLFGGLFPDPAPHPREGAVMRP